MRRLRTFLLVFVIILVCFIVETTVLPVVSILGITPNLMMIVTASLGFMFGDRSGIFIGAGCGLLCDIFFGPLIGFQTAVYALVGYLAGKFQKVLYVEDLAFPLTLIAACDLLYGFLSYVFLFLMRNRLFLRAFFLGRMVPEMVYTLVAAVFLFPFLRFLYNKFMKPVRHQTLEAGGLENTQR